MSELCSDDSDSEDSEDEDLFEANLVVKMLSNLRMRNKNIHECMEHNKEPDLYQIR